MNKDIPSTNESDSLLTPPEITKIAKETTANLLPNKSREKYTNTYDNFMKWRSEKKIKSLSENVILAYLTELSHTHKPSSLWATYSMLKSTLNAKNNINIHNYPKLVPFLKKQSQGFKSKKSKTLTAEEIKKFLHEAPDNKYLDLKVNIINIKINVYIV
ncbi:hypothetical protein ALC60_14097 [Trachymyrmex zeteki]|uniref:Core-binding (CB) domain-containing protein n=1 Tax=Mycetomoellerius zeteki TaxID=64791 RepID=A0A151WGG3_9HYME|nr:hypothetical protein ALC60_14097 [Trachymyrmex zeteki]